MSPVLAPDDSAKCECGERWVLKTPKVWGVRMTCVAGHSRDFPTEIVPRTNAVQTIGGRGGYPAEVVEAPSLSLWLRVRLWLWKKTRGRGD